jgi:hypothetical protein
MFLFLVKMSFYICVIMSVLTTFYYVELYGKMLKELESINKKLGKLSKTKN